MADHLHVISFDVPYPPDYGGVIEVFYKLKALQDQGVDIHLHCFQYGRGPSEELEKICHSVRYYQRKDYLQKHFSDVPYIVRSRESTQLLDNLSKDDHPVLFEGLHTCFHIADPALENRTKIVRAHNVEWDYYRHLGTMEQNWLKKFYFHMESLKLKHFEPILDHATHILAISPQDAVYLSGRYNNSTYVPAFHSNDHVGSNPGMGEYALYHGNLSIEENNRIALNLIKDVFPGLRIPLMIAGKDPGTRLIKAASEHDHISVKVNPDPGTIADIIKNAHVILLPALHHSGIKLKLLESLFNGRYCLTNSMMVDQTGLEDLCINAETADDIKEKLTELFTKAFDESEIEKRETTLTRAFSNAKGAQKIIQLAYA